MKIFWQRYKAKLDERLSDEEGAATIILFPCICIIGMMLFALLFNTMWLNQNRYHAQLMLDSASRAGSQAVEYTYVVKERSGAGYDGYHLYLELDKDQAADNANRIIDRYRDDMPGLVIEEIKFNESMTPSYFWNSNEQKYDIKPMKEVQQYKHGNFSIKMKAKIPTVASDMYGGAKSITFDAFSLSQARGKVVGIK